MKPNPKTHDGLFKWLITSFTAEFFAHCFPDVNVENHRFIDKEFISRYEALKESLKGDLFMAMEVEIAGELKEVVIQIEHTSERKDMGERVFEYLCYAWLLKRKPVWSIVVYTDDAVWRKRVPDSFWYAFKAKEGKVFHRFDVIKVKDEKSVDLIKKQSLMCRLLALKANNKGADPEALIRGIYKAAVQEKDRLTDDQLLLIGQWVEAYKKIPDIKLEKIKEEAGMNVIETTISEHVFNQGKQEGKIEGKQEGKIEGKIEMLENLYLEGVLSKEQFEKKAALLRQMLKDACDFRLFS